MPKIQLISNNNLRKVSTDADYRRSSGTFYDEIIVVSPSQALSRIIPLKYRYLRGHHQLEVYVNGLFKRVIEIIDGVEYGDYEETDDFKVKFKSGVIETGDVVRFRIMWGAYLPANMAAEVLSEATRVGKAVFGEKYTTTTRERTIGLLDSSTTTPDLSLYRTWKITANNAVYENFTGCVADDIKYLIFGTDGSLIQSTYHLVELNSSISWQKVASGNHFNVAIKTDGTLWVWGKNDKGQLGLGDHIDRSIPTKVGIENYWTDVAVMNEHVLALHSDGSLWAWGANESGQLGIGNEINQNEPQQVGIETHWKSISCGFQHSLALKTDGTIWAWGNNQSGQLGLGDTNDRNTPTQVTGLLGAYDFVDAGYYFSIAMKSDGTLWSWGAAESGQLGINETINKSIPRQIGTDTNWSKFSCGGYFTVAIKNDGTLWAWGRNNYGQLGLGDNVDRHVPVLLNSSAVWTNVYAGESHFIVIKSDESIYGCGKNNDNQLGIFTNNHQFQLTAIDVVHDFDFISCGKTHSMLIRTTGNMWHAGTNTNGERGIVLQPYPIKLQGGKDFVGHEGDTIQLIFDGEYWYELTRSLNS